MPKLKVGILLDSFILPAWAFHALERAVNLDSVNISVIILNDLKDPLTYKPDFFHKDHQNTLYRLIGKIDKAIFLRGPDAFAPINAQGLFTNIPVIRIKPENVGSPGYFDARDTAKIIDYRLDILIRMGFEDLTGDILSAARYGVWTYYHGDPWVIRSNLPGFWEVVDRIPETGSILYVLNDDSAIGKVLYRSWVQTFPFSPARNRNRCYWLSSSFLSRQIDLLYQLGDNDFFTEIEKYNQELDDHKIKQYCTPSNLIVIWLFIKLLARDVHEAFQRITYLDHWRLLFDINHIPSFSFSKFKEVIPPRDRFWADPQIIQVESKYYIYIEEYIYKERKAQISLIEMEQNGACQKPVQILSKDYHLSYPFVFEWNKKYYMVPETSENRTIELYECLEFPFEWQFRMNLMEKVIAVDTTVFYHQNRWWLFTGITENDGAFPEVELFLFYSSELFTDNWISHPLNPIVSDVKKARPAGKIFTENGKIYRPSQDCSKNYGWGFNINEILLLSETGYLERTVTEVRPNWDKKIVAEHTFSKTGLLTVIDACKKKRRFF